LAASQAGALERRPRRANSIVIGVADGSIIATIITAHMTVAIARSAARQGSTRDAHIAWP
jgi:hypothetical protein